ncbi:MAG: radical SAM protein [Lentisphaerae bacterium]|nr:radical SAM protein [Lentisphaerota bacterium]
MRKQYIFGPVASRRLGVSLGIDLIHARRCSLDCIYCEAGKTEELTACRADYVDLDAVKNELAEFLATAPELDYLTFSGAGEPTLNSRIAEFCSYLKHNYGQYKICLLTNGTLLNDPAVRQTLEFVDLCMPNFDASDDRELELINRPAPGITVDALADGIRQAASEYPGKLVLELFVVPGINDSDASIDRFAAYIKSFAGLKSVQLNTLDRPGVEKWVKPADSQTLKRFITALEPILPVECIGRYRYRSNALRKNVSPGKFDSAILTMARCRAVCAEDMLPALDVPLELISQRAEELVQAGLLSAEKCGSRIYYRAE